MIFQFAMSPSEIRLAMIEAENDGDLVRSLEYANNRPTTGAADQRQFIQTWAERTKTLSPGTRKLSRPADEARHVRELVRVHIQGVGAVSAGARLDKLKRLNIHDEKKFPDSIDGVWSWDSDTGDVYMNSLRWNPAPKADADPTDADPTDAVPQAQKALEAKAAIRDDLMRAATIIVPQRPVPDDLADALRYAMTTAPWAQDLPPGMKPFPETTPNQPKENQAMNQTTIAASITGRSIDANGLVVGTTVSPDLLKVETRTFVNGMDISHMPKSTIYALIAGQEAVIKSLNSIENKPVMLAKEIAERQAGINALVAYLDSQDPDAALVHATTKAQATVRKPRAKAAPAADTAAS